jgi:hypothetical protein
MTTAADRTRVPPTRRRKRVAVVLPDQPPRLGPEAAAVLLHILRTAAMDPSRRKGESDGGRMGHAG